MPKNETRSQMNECRNCHCPVGEKPKVLPHRVDGGNEDWETFCPSCFVYFRAPKEPVRFTPGAYAPIHCVGCGWDSVAHGLVKCLLCGGRHVLLLAQRTAIVQAS